MIESLAIFSAGIWAGGINVIVGSGTLVNFPTLLPFGCSPVVANISNDLGMVAGGVSGFGRRLPPAALRVIIVVIGSVAPVKILLFA